MEKKRIAAAAAVVIVLAGAALWTRLGSNKQTQQQTETARVAKGSVAPVLSVTGVVAADERKLSPPAGGSVAQVYVKEGDLVTAGQKLLALDGDDAQQDVNITWASYKSARARLQELRDKPASAAEIAGQDAAVAKALADYRKADKARDSLVVTSPIAGTVIDLSVAVGDQAGSAQGAGSQGDASGLATVADLTKLYLRATADQADVSKVAVGQSAKVTLDALPGQEFTGRITSVDPVPETNQNVVTYTVYLAVDKLDPAARLGMTADVNIDLGKKDGILVVPNIAVRSRGNNKIVTKLVDGEEAEVTVETGASDGENTEITSGLFAGDRLVIQSFSSQGTGSSGGGSFSGGRSGFGGGRGSGMMIPAGGPR